MGALGWAALLLAGWAAASPQDEHEQGPYDAEPSLYPMPAFASDKNAGVMYGLLGALILKDKDGRPDTLLTATVAYRSLVNWNGDVNLHLYPTVQSEFEFDGSAAEKVETEFKLAYKDLRLLDRYDLRLELHETRSSNDRFFGRAEDAPRGDESALTSNVYWFNGAFGPRLTEEVTLQGTARWRQFRVGRSLIDNLPQMLDRFPDEPGIEGGAVLAAGVRLVVDTRDLPTTPSQGTLGTVFAELAHYDADGRSTPFWVLGAQWTWLVPADADRRFVSVLNARAQAVAGPRVPFWELSSLGGTSTLRSFNDARFTDNDLVALSVEERIRIVKVDLFGLSGEVQVAPFFDVGKVLDSLDDLIGGEATRHAHYSYGVGFRGVVPPSFVGRLDLAYGSEGLGITIGLNYPF